MSNPVVQIQQFAIVTPAGTPVATPQTKQMQTGGNFTLEWIELRVPPNWRGQAGFAILASGQQVIPFTTGNARNWLIMDGESVHWDLAHQPDSGDWQLLSYNLGNYPHTLYVRFGLSLPPKPAHGVNIIPLIPPAVLAGVSGAA